MARQHAISSQTSAAASARIGETVMRALRATNGVGFTAAVAGDGASGAAPVRGCATGAAGPDAPLCSVVVAESAIGADERSETATVRTGVSTSAASAQSQIA